ncbi:hypothetical protein ACHAXT_000526 [Thalassiosira profunda]
MSSADEGSASEPAALRGGGDDDGMETPPAQDEPASAALPAAPPDDGGGGEDELLRLKRQVAALAASNQIATSKDNKTRMEKTKLTKDEEEHQQGEKKKGSIFSYWDEKGKVAEQKKHEDPEAAVRQAGEGFVTPKAMYSTPAHSYTPSMATTPPLGRPPNQSAKLLYNNQAKSPTGEKWNPHKDIQGGHIGKVKSTFESPRHNSEAVPKIDAQKDIGSRGSVNKFKDAFESPKATSPRAPGSYRSGKIDTSRFEKKAAGDVPPPPVAPGRRWRPPSKTAAAGAAAAGAEVGVGVAAAATASDDASHNSEAEHSASKSANSESVQESGQPEKPEAAGEAEAENEEVAEDEAAPEAEPAATEPDIGETATREEIVALVAEVLPDELESVDDLLAQFEGREDKLMATLMSMKARAATADEYEEEEGEGSDGGIDAESGSGRSPNQNVAAVGGAAALGTAAAIGAAYANPDAMSAHEGSTLESVEVDPKYGAQVSGLPLNPSWLQGSTVDPNAEDATAPRDNMSPARDKFTGQSYRYDSPSKASSGDMEGGKPMPLVRAGTGGTKDTGRPESVRSFETFSIGVPTIIAGGSPGKAGDTNTVVSAIPNPVEREQPTPWHKKRRNQYLGCLALLLLAAGGAVLGLYFGGAFGSGDDPEQTDESIKAVDPGAAGTDGAAPTSLPSAMPSGNPVSACEQALGEYATLELGNSPNVEPPNVAMDGKHAAVVTNGGDLQFYRLNDENVWEETEFFTSLNRSPATPPVALSGNVAVIGYIYQIVGFGVSQGGAYVYERDPDTGKWALAQVLVPEEGVDGTARFGWSVAVDASTDNPLITVGAFGEADGRGSIYAFERQSDGVWDRVGKILPGECKNGNFGYSVAVYGDLVAGSTDCESIVQVHQYKRSTGVFEYAQEIRYISFDLGAVSSLVMNADNLSYSTVYGGVIIYERGDTAERIFDFSDSLDLRATDVYDYPLAIDEDIIVVGVGNQYVALPKGGDSWGGENGEDSIIIVNDRASPLGISPVAVSGRDILAGSGEPHEVYAYNVGVCTGETARPTKLPTPEPTMQPTSKATPPPPPTPKPVTSSPTKQAAPPPPPLTTPPPAPACEGGQHPVEINILFDGSPLGSGYVLSLVEGTEETSVDTFFPFDESLANERYIQQLCLEEGSYKFIIYDSAGDGLCCTDGEGEYRITSDGTTLAQGGEFEFSEETRFDLPA